MPKPLMKFAPYFIHDTKHQKFGFIAFSPNGRKIPVFSKGNARMFIERALHEGVIQKDESLELLRQISESNLKEEMDAPTCVLILSNLNLQEIYGDCFSNSMYHPSRN